MQKKFKFTNAKLKVIKPHDVDSPSTELELSDDSDVSCYFIAYDNMYYQK